MPAAAALEYRLPIPFRPPSTAAERRPLQWASATLVKTFHWSLRRSSCRPQRPHNVRAFFSMVVNASNRDKIATWIDSHLPSSGVEFSDLTTSTAMIAVQGPLACQLVKNAASIDVTQLRNYFGNVTSITGQPMTVSRTGYTGEDGCELIVPSDAAVELWSSIMSAGEPLGVIAAGLGARDTLRLEAAMPLYGHELSEQINPYQAGLAFAVNTKGRDFIGRDAIVAAQQDANMPKRVGLKVDGKRVPREHYAVVADGKTIGEVTSGTFSPTLQTPIAMAYVQPQYSADGTGLAIDIRGRQQPAQVAPLPFYARS